MIRFEHPLKAVPGFASEETPGGEVRATTIDSRAYALESIAVHILRSGNSGEGKGAVKGYRGMWQLSFKTIANLMTARLARKGALSENASRFSMDWKRRRFRIIFFSLPGSDLSGCGYHRS